MNGKCRHSLKISIETSDIKLLKIKCRYLWIIALYGIMINWEKQKLLSVLFAMGKQKLLSKFLHPFSFQYLDIIY